MVYEFIATLAAGFGMAGLALIIRHLTTLLLSRHAPKWLIPVFAGIGMLGFQIYQEYHWQDQQLVSWDDDLRVVQRIEGAVWYRPWSYAYPQVIRMMAMGDVQTLTPHSNVKVINLYLFERRVSTKVVPQLIDCDQPAMAVDPAVARQAKRLTGAPLTAVLRRVLWQPLSAEDKLTRMVCESH